MLRTIFVLLLLVWFLGMFTSYTFGGLIHIILAAAVVLVIIGIVQRRKPI